MSKQDKLIKRFLAHPVDFTWDEMTALLKGFGYTRVKAGKTGGSRVRFDHRTSDPIILHRPHPTSTLKRYQIEQVCHQRFDSEPAAPQYKGAIAAGPVRPVI